jgi:hypothetical protein
VQLCLKTVIKVVFFKDFFCKNSNKSFICYICAKKHVFAGLRKFYVCKKLRLANSKSTNYKSANHKKIGCAHRKSAKCLICRRSANLTNYIRPHGCGFAICGTYLRTAHIWHSPSAHLYRLPCTVEMFESALNNLIKHSLLLSGVILL